MAAQSTYRDALIDDGRYVLYQVTTKLYQGIKLRPDEYFRQDSCLNQKNYKRIFNSQQQGTIVSSGAPTGYDISEGARRFDVSLHALLIEHTCGLTTGDALLKKVMQVKKRRNEVSHPEVLMIVPQSCAVDSYDRFTGATKENLNQLLKELLQLYHGIIRDLEEKTGDDLQSIKMKVEAMIYQRLNQFSSLKTTTEVSDEETDFYFVDSVEKTNGAHRHQPSYSVHNHVKPTPAVSTSGFEIPTWGKVALGLTVGIAALGIAAACSNDEDKGRSEIRTTQGRNNQGRNNQGRNNQGRNNQGRNNQGRNNQRRNNQEDECIVM